MNFSGPRPLSKLLVRARPGFRTQGILQAGNRTMRCALGRGGLTSAKREGDGATPLGTFSLLEAFGPHTQSPRPFAGLGWKRVSNNDGWCDSLGDRNYNQPVQLPYPVSHETLIRQDHLYDRVVVLDFNVTRRLTRGGSAIFFHLAHEDYRPTEGCVAIARRDMEWLAPRLNRDTKMMILPG